MTDEQWTPVPTWKDEQPYRCTLCNDTFAGRELGYMPAMCERDGCDGGPGRPDPVEVVPVSSVVPITRLREFVEENFAPGWYYGPNVHTTRNRLAALLDDVECASNPNNERTT